MDKELKHQIDRWLKANNQDTTSFKHRAEAFWQWFLRKESKLSKMLERLDKYSSEEITEFIAKGTSLLAEDVHFNIGGDKEFAFSIEGNYHLFYLYPYLISLMPEQLKGKWHFFPFNQGITRPLGLHMYSINVNTADVYVAVDYNEKQNNFAIAFYEENLCSLPEEQSYETFYTMMEIMLGEGLSYLYISEVERSDKLTAAMIPLPELSRHIAKTLNEHGKEVFDNPQKTYICYHLNPQDNDELRSDVVVGNTCFSGLISQYYQHDTELSDNLKQFGTQAAFLTFAYEKEDDGTERGNNVLSFRHDLEERIEREILQPEGLGLLLGGALGTKNCYIDILLYDIRSFLEKVVPLLREYPQYSFYLSDFRPNGQLLKLS